MPGPAMCSSSGASSTSSAAFPRRCTTGGRTRISIAAWSPRASLVHAGRDRPPRHHARPARGQVPAQHRRADGSGVGRAGAARTGATVPRLVAGPHRPMPAGRLPAADLGLALRRRRGASRRSTAGPRSIVHRHRGRPADLPPALQRPEVAAAAPLCEPACSSNGGMYKPRRLPPLTYAPLPLPRPAGDDHGPLVRVGVDSGRGADAGEPLLPSGVHAGHHRVRDDVQVGLIERDGRPVGFLPFRRGASSIGSPVGGRLNDFHRSDRLGGSRLERRRVAAGLPTGSLGLSSFARLAAAIRGPSRDRRAPRRTSTCQRLRALPGREGQGVGRDPADSPQVAEVRARRRPAPLRVSHRRRGRLRNAARVEG